MALRDHFWHCENTRFSKNRFKLSFSNRARVVRQGFAGDLIYGTAHLKLALISV